MVSERGGRGGRDDRLEAPFVGRDAELRLLNREAALLRQVRAVPVPLSELASPPTPN